MTLCGHPRADGRKGIRNIVAVACRVEYAHHVAREIARPHRDRAHVTGVPGCFPKPCAQRMMERLCTHPSAGAVLLVSLGYGSFASGNADGGLTTIEKTSRGAEMKSGQSRISGLIKPGEIPPSALPETPGHPEFILTYKSFEPLGPACLPV
jgi:altronate dehydratase